MDYDKFIDICIQSMKDGTFKQSHAYQSMLYPDETISCNDLNLKMKIALLELMDSDIQKFFSSVNILAECNSHIQKILTECHSEILNVILAVLKNAENGCTTKLLSTAIKALYTILQYFSSTCSVTPELKKIFKDIMIELEKHITSDDLASDISLISSSSLVLLISLICSSPLHYFDQILINLFNLNDTKNNMKENSSCANKEEVVRNDCKVKEENDTPSYIMDGFKCYSNISKANLNIIHGVLNVKPKWLFEIEFYDEESLLKINNKYLLFRLWPYIQSHCLTASNHCSQCTQVLNKWIEILCKYIKETFINSNNDNLQMVKHLPNSSDVIEEEHLLPCSSVEQIHLLNERSPLQSSNVFNNDSDHSGHSNVSLSICELCTDLSVGTLLSIESGQIVELLNICFEKKGKDISNQTLKSYKELLNLHECFRQGHSIFSVQKMLKSITSAPLHSKGAYLHIQMAIESLGHQRVLDDYVSIPQSLALGLRTNQFATLATNVYCILLTQLSTLEWLKYFETIHQSVIQTSDHMMWSNYKNLWLPQTLSHHPELVMTLLKLSEKSSRELEAKIAILRIFRSRSDLNIFSEFYLNIPESYEDYVSYFTLNKEEDIVINDSRNFEGNDAISCLCLSGPGNKEEDIVTNDSRKIEENDTISDLCLSGHGNKEEDIVANDLCLPDPSFYLKCLVHGDENIRSELFSLLSLNRKISTPLSQFETRLLKMFFSQNLNVDSKCFRESVMKSFHVLLCRIKDSSLQILKKYKNSLNETSVNEILSSSVGPGADFLIWIINYLNNNLNCLGNYPRLATTLNLYYILLSTFYDNKNKSIDSKNKCKNFGHLIHLASQSNEGLYKVVYPNFLCPRSLDSLLTCCTNAMNDLRDLAADILILLNNNNDLFTYCGLEKSCLEKFLEYWFVVAFQLIDSPKTNDVESGANLIKVLLEIRPEKSFIPIKNWDFFDVDSFDYDSKTYHERFVNYLLRKIETEFAEAKSNVLISAYSKPISGTILALTYCLAECQRIIKDLSIESVMKVVSSLAELYREISSFVLDSLSACSSDGPKIPPSFADMGKSIDAFVEKYNSSKPKIALPAVGDEPLGVKGLNEMSGIEGVNRMSDEVNVNGECSRVWEEEKCSNFNSVGSREEFLYDHQMILSFFWHLLKMSCWSTSKLTQKYYQYMSDDIYEKFLVATVMRVLVGTRHKGAMESAQESLAVMVESAFQESLKDDGMLLESRIEIVERQLDNILKRLEISVNQPKISATRKAAGYAMIFTAICSNIPGKSRKTNDQVISRLLNIARTKIESCDDCGSVDLPSSLSLHILHSLVLSSKMNNSVTQYLSSISIVCLQSFASEVWSVRNAALQLFGAVVPKLLGQKKVKDDTALSNSITAAVFCNRNPSLTAVILNLLNLCSNSEQEAVHHFINDDKEKIHTTISHRAAKIPGDIHLDLDRESVKLKTNSFLVPLLSLLARLNPGNEMQQNDKLRYSLNRFVTYILPLLGNSVFVIRRLAAISLVNLSDNQAKEEILGEYTKNSNTVAFSEIHTNPNSIALRQGNNYAHDSSTHETLASPEAHTNPTSITLQEGNNYIHGMLLFIENILVTNAKFFEDRVTLRIRVVKWLKKLLYSKCFVNVSLTLNILLKFSDTEKDETLISSLQDSFDGPGTCVLSRTITRIRLRRNELDVCELLMSPNQDVWEETFNFVTKSLEEKNIKKIDLTLLQRILLGYLKCQTVTHNHKSDVKLLKYLELLSIILEHISIDSEIISKESLITLQAIFNSDYNLKRYACIVFSWTIRDGIDLSTNLDSCVLDIILQWALTIEFLSSPKMTEDCRLSASKALKISFETVLKGLNDKEIIYPLIKATFNLLQDEDCTIRTKSSMIININILTNSTVVNPIITLSVLVNRIVTLSFKNFDYINLLWDLSLKQYQESNEINSRYSFNLFESTKNNNVYSEPHVVLEMICSELDKQVESFCNVEREFKTKASHFVAEKEIFLQNLMDSFKNEIYEENFQRLFCWGKNSKMAVMKYGLKFLQHLASMSDIQFGNNFLEILKEFSEFHV